MKNKIQELILNSATFDADSWEKCQILAAIGQLIVASYDVRTSQTLPSTLELSESLPSTLEQLQDRIEEL